MEDEDLIDYIEFQFLIGRLRTDYPGGYKEVIIKFQFLIGRLRTLIMWFKEERFKFVSIPHR